MMDLDDDQRENVVIVDVCFASTGMCCLCDRCRRDEALAVARRDRSRKRWRGVLKMLTGGTS